MSKRFFAGSSVGAMLIALAALVLVSIPGLALSRAWPVTLMWCFVPFVWGIWALLTPRSWLPGRLPYWGAILGFVGGWINAIILDFPSLVLGRYVPLSVRWIVVATVTVAYYFLWMLVRSSLEALVPREQQPEKLIGITSMKRAA